MGSKQWRRLWLFPRHDNLSFDPNSESIKGKLSFRAYSDITSNAIAKCYNGKNI